MRRPYRPSVDAALIGVGLLAIVAGSVLATVANRPGEWGAVAVGVLFGVVGTVRSITARRRRREQILVAATAARSR